MDLTTLKTLNGVDLHGTGNITYDTTLSDSSTNAVQNKVLKGYIDDFSTRLSVLEESIIADETLNYTYLSQSAIPTNSNTYPILESAGIDNTDIKGHSFVYNQLVQNPYGTINAGGSSTTAKAVQVIAGHKYFLIHRVSRASQGNQSDYQTFLRFAGSTTDYGYNAIEFAIRTYNTSGTLGIGYQTYSSFAGTVNYEWYVIDLTQSGIDSATTSGDVIALLRQNGINPYEYNSYNVGKINDSKPTALISHGFNVWDEEWEVGYINDSGVKTSANNTIRSKNYMKVIPNAEYYVRVGDIGGPKICFYANNNESSFISFQWKANGTITAPANAKYFKITTNTTYGGTYRNDICINLSNASLNGTYRPYKAPITYSLDVPVLRSTSSVQDNNIKANVGTVTFDGSEDEGWAMHGDASYKNFRWTNNPIQNLVKKPTSNSVAFNGLCNNLSIIDYNSRRTVGYANISIDTDGYIGIVVTASSVTDLTTFKTWLSNNNVILNYELATPTDQPTITLPENIDFEKGGSLEITYDSTAPTPSDFDFEVAVYKPIQ